ncbi:hypothetical protein [Cellulomonas phragmiteti]|uniref:Uncharacterized protein n=1 Tax=Cellulomonas phragmiteti TaxID=478780 RepID=A0ABQ4DMT7_9CELL|nr:hypothetical protein [Cellulomonas phragmiteti]GIG40667.1 hypothetical protein Cph01nite_24290 [Cellulomonas phragmiteti]
MSVPDDTVTPTPHEVPDPVEATAPTADPALDDAPDDALPDGTEPGDPGTVQIPGNRAGSGFA